MSFGEFIKSEHLECEKDDKEGIKKQQERYDEYIKLYYAEAKVSQDEINRLYSLYVQDFYDKGDEDVYSRDVNPIDRKSVV